MQYGLLLSHFEIELGMSVVSTMPRSTHENYELV